jgi:hypothetical protein
MSLYLLYLMTLLLIRLYNDDGRIISVEGNSHGLFKMFYNFSGDA